MTLVSSVGVVEPFLAGLFERRVTFVETGEILLALCVGAAVCENATSGACRSYARTYN
jgi:hypothetical protein